MKMQPKKQGQDTGARKKKGEKKITAGPGLVDKSPHIK